MAEFSTPLSKKFYNGNFVLKIGTLRRAGDPNRQRALRADDGKHENTVGRQETLAE